MYAATATVTNPSGLHARPATIFVEEAKKYASKIFVKNLSKGSDAKNAKSPIMLLTLAVTKGTEIEISADGDDEVNAVNNLIKLVESGFGEEEEI